MLSSTIKVSMAIVASALNSAAATNRHLQMGSSNGMGMMGLREPALASTSSQIQTPQYTYLDLNVYNLAYIQPLSPFFVMVHNDRAEPLFRLGKRPSDPLAELAEFGNPGNLTQYYTGMEGVLSAQSFTLNAPTELGEELVIPIMTTPDYPYVTIASMFVNSNDGFVAINGMVVKSGDHIYSPGYDAGSEENNELCSSMPGPACPSDSGNVRSGNGEGYVHIHRGFQGAGDLPATNYDWRNPMMLVVVG